MSKSTQQTTVLELAHDLTPDEQLGLQKKIMGLLDDKEDLEEELDSASKEFKRAKADIEKRQAEKDAEINKVRSEIKIGREMRKHRVIIHRDRDSRMVEYSVMDGPLEGEIIKREPFTQADWDALLEDSQQPIPFTEPADENEQPDLRAQADLTAEPELGPDKDENDRVVAGPNTDAYNLANPGDTTYQHLSQHIDFAPAVTSVQQADADAGAEPTDAADVDRDDLPATVTDEFESNDSADDSDDDEPSEDDEPQTPAPKLPKRPANRRK